MQRLGQVQVQGWGRCRCRGWGRCRYRCRAGAGTRAAAGEGQVQVQVRALGQVQGQRQGRGRYRAGAGAGAGTGAVADQGQVQGQRQGHRYEEHIIIIFSSQITSAESGPVGATVMSQLQETWHRCRHNYKSTGFGQICSRDQKVHKSVSVCGARTSICKTCWQCLSQCYCTFACQTVDTCTSPFICSACLTACQAVMLAHTPVTCVDLCTINITHALSHILYQSNKLATCRWHCW